MSVSFTCLLLIPISNVNKRPAQCILRLVYVTPLFLTFVDAAAGSSAVEWSAVENKATVPPLVIVIRTHLIPTKAVGCEKAVKTYVRTRTHGKRPLRERV